ncbi:unnamed protein product [Musa textilis]
MVCPSRYVSTCSLSFDPCPQIACSDPMMLWPWIHHDINMLLSFCGEMPVIVSQPAHSLMVTAAGGCDVIRGSSICISLFDGDQTTIMEMLLCAKHMHVCIEQDGEIMDACTINRLTQPSSFHPPSSSSDAEHCNHASRGDCRHLLPFTFEFSFSPSLLQHVTEQHYLLPVQQSLRAIHRTTIPERANHAWLRCGRPPTERSRREEEEKDDIEQGVGAAVADEKAEAPERVVVAGHPSAVGQLPSAR